jgi:hypothetical protein
MKIETEKKLEIQNKIENKTELKNNCNSEKNKVIFELENSNSISNSKDKINEDINITNGNYLYGETEIVQVRD